MTKVIIANKWSSQPLLSSQSISIYEAQAIVTAQAPRLWDIRVKRRGRACHALRSLTCHRGCFWVLQRCAESVQAAGEGPGGSQPACRGRLVGG